MELPLEFQKRMQELLGEEWEAFRESFSAPPFRGVRLNSLKCTLPTLKESLPFEIFPAPFSPDSFYGPGEKVGKLPAHHSGMFYAQEPSASCAVTVLAPEPGEKILDLCAAPGGKSGQIAALLKGKGLLWSNEIVRSRAAVLLSNLERLGVRNSVISSCHPKALCEKLQGFFDRVLVDAPCSGEGMFRKDPEAVAQWTPESAEACARRQMSILDCAAMAVREGGILVYSTCTFSPEENERAVLNFLKAHPEFSPDPVEVSFGRPALLGVSGIRIYPMDGGEGHFAARLRRAGENSFSGKPCSAFLPAKKAEKLAQWYGEIFSSELSERILSDGDKFFQAPEGLPEFSRLGVLRVGVELGEQRGDRVEPAHGLFMSRLKEECRQTVDFSASSQELEAFLRGEEIPFEGKGYAAVCVQGVVTGFGKASGGRLKNRYPKGLRNRE